MAVQLMRKFSSFMRSLSAEDLHAVVSGRARLQLVYSSPPAAAKSSLSSPHIRELLDRLNRSSSRGEAMRILTEEYFTRADLVQIAGVLDIPVEKADRVSKVREKIVEGAIGYRLRSEAIRGEPSERRSEGLKSRQPDSDRRL